VGSGVLGAIGVATLTKVRHRRELLFAGLPTLFAVHQFIEGFVWLGLDGILPPVVTRDMSAAFLLYAQGLLPFLLPLSVLVFEPDAKSRRRMLPFLVIGGGTTLYILWALTAYPFQVYVRSHSIVYTNQATGNIAVGVLYVIATCGSLFFSKVKDMVIFGAANLVILLVVMAVKRYAYTSLWCAYAAIASVIILVYFWRSVGDRPFRMVAAEFATRRQSGQCDRQGNATQRRSVTQIPFLKGHTAEPLIAFQTRVVKGILTMIVPGPHHPSR